MKPPIMTPFFYDHQDIHSAFKQWRWGVDHVFPILHKSATENMKRGVIHLKVEWLWGPIETANLQWVINSISAYDYETFLENLSMYKIWSTPVWDPHDLAHVRLWDHSIPAPADNILCCKLSRIVQNIRVSQVVNTNTCQLKRDVQRSDPPSVT